MRVGLILKENAEMIAVIELERFMSSTCILYIIICKFYHGYEFCLVIPFSIDKNPQIKLDCTILLPNLTIRLRIKDNEKLLLEVEKIV